MAKQSVVDMLKNPVHKPMQVVPQTDMVGDAELRAMAMRHINKKSMDNALAELKPKLDEAEAKVKKAETELAGTKADLATAQAKLIQMEAMHAKMETMNASAKSAKDATELTSAMAYDEEFKKRISSESKNMELTGRISELEKANADLHTSLTRFNMNNMKPITPILPEFDIQVTSRDTDGSIKKLSVVPKKISH